MNHSSRVIVIGSGPPGATAAVTLAKAGVDVLLLEAGSERAALGLTLRVGGMTIAKQRHRLLQRPAVVRTGAPDAQIFEDLSPGGLSNHWSCAVPRFSHEDFVDAQRGGPAYAWPIGYDDLAPWYARVEPLLHIAGTALSEPQLPAGNARHAWELDPSWEPVQNAARELGRCVLPMPYAYGADTTLTFSGTAFNAFVRLVQPALRAGQLAIKYDARVTGLEWSPSSRRVVAVVFRDTRSGVENRIPCRAVVVAAGAVNSAEILLRSKSADFPNGIGNTHDVLGRYLHDHPLGKLVVDLPVPVPAYPPSYITRPRLERARPLYAAAGMQWSGAARYAQGLLKSRRWGQLTQLGFSVFGTMAPTTNDFVRPESSLQRADGEPGLAFNIRHPREAIDTLNEARDEIMSVLERAGWQPRLKVWKIEPPGSANHYGGTCRMHASPEYGMLDGFGRLHAVRNVAVTDSAAFTTGPEKNPVLTAMALSARASDRLAQELKSGDL